MSLHRLTKERTAPKPGLFWEHGRSCVADGAETNRGLVTEGEWPVGSHPPQRVQLKDCFYAYEHLSEECHAIWREVRSAAAESLRTSRPCFKRPTIGPSASFKPSAATAGGPTGPPGTD